MTDAWEQLHNLVDKFTTRTEVRADIEVVARATERGVELILWDTKWDPRSLKPSYRTTGKRNVSTMRELAQTILDACDFVDESNPEWASTPEWAAVGDMTEIILSPAVFDGIEP